MSKNYGPGQPVFTVHHCIPVHNQAKLTEDAVQPYSWPFGFVSAKTLRVDTVHARVGKTVLASSEPKYVFDSHKHTLPHLLLLYDCKRSKHIFGISSMSTEATIADVKPMGMHYRALSEVASPQCAAEWQPLGAEIALNALFSCRDQTANLFTTFRPPQSNTSLNGKPQQSTAIDTRDWRDES